MLNDFRLSLSSNAPVSVEGTTASVIYMTPYIGNRIELWTGAAWDVFHANQISLTLSGLVSGKNYDVLVYYDTTTHSPKLELSPGWESDTGRLISGTYDVEKFHGVYCKINDPTRLYLGTFRTVSTSTVTDSVAKRFLWNHYNRIDRNLTVVDTTASWGWSGSAGTPTYRQANGSTANAVEFVIGLSVEDGAAVSVYGLTAGSNAAVVTTDGGVALSTFSGTTSTNAILQGCNPNSLTLAMTAAAMWFGSLIIGYRKITWLDSSNTSGLNTFYGKIGTVTQSGLVARIPG